MEAADNVVHAYDLNMQVPDTPVPPIDEETSDTQLATSSFERRPNILIEGNNIPINPNKRRRSASFEWTYAPAAKHRAVESATSTPGREVSPRTEALRTVILESKEAASTLLRSHPTSVAAGSVTDRNPSVSETGDPIVAGEFDHLPTPGLRHTKLRELLHLLINESLRVGGRPESAIAEDTERGELIEVRSRSSKGDTSTKMIEWSVDPSVPEVVSGELQFYASNDSHTTNGIDSRRT